MSSTPSSNDPIESDEGILRRVPPTWWQGEESGKLPRKVFLPRKPNKKNPNDHGDVDGLSVSREKITSAENASRLSPEGKRGSVVRVAAKLIYDVEISIIPNPQEHNQGHCLLPEINNTKYGSEEEDWMLGIAAMLAAKSTIVWKI